MWNRLILRKPRAFLWVVSGPSGSGKTTICKKIMGNKNLRLSRSISYTTRPIRKGEKNGRDYFFVSKKEFLRKIKKGDFLEWKKVFNNFYGTSKKLVFSFLKNNKDVLLSIDVKGAQDIKAMYPNVAVLIFVLPPHEKELINRIKKRAREDSKEIKRRLAFAKTEIAFAKKYDYIVVNDNLNNTVKQLESIIIAKRLENVLHTVRKNSR